MAWLNLMFTHYRRHILQNKLPFNLRRLPFIKDISCLFCFLNILICIEDHMLDKCCTLNISSSENEDYIIIIIMIIIIIWALQIEIQRRIIYGYFF